MGRNSSFTVDDPVVSVRTVGQTTNIEATLAEMFGAAASDEESESFPVAVTINNGTIRLLKPVDEQRMSNVVSLSDINGSFSSVSYTHLTLPTIYSV